MQLSVLFTIAFMTITMSVAALPAMSSELFSARELSLVHGRTLNSHVTTRSDPQVNNVRRRRGLSGSGGQFYPRSPTSLGQSIRDARLRSHLSQADLARKIGTTIAAVAQYEAGSASPSASMLVAIGIALGVKLHG